VPLKEFTLLYVEDDKSTQESMELLLAEEVKEFYQAFNGQEGLEIYKSLKPDIILTDIQMPFLNGLQMATEIKKIDPKQAILVTSAYDDKENLLKFIEIGLDKFISKPIDVENLFEQLNSVASRLQTFNTKVDTHKEKMESLYDLAHYDSLTGVANRLLFDIKLNQAIDKATQEESIFTLLFIDVDKFKTINDTYGHIAGDRVLKTIAKTILSFIDDKDTFARISGDEFAVIVEGSKYQSKVSDLIKKFFATPFISIEVEGKTVDVSCSIGSSMFPVDSRGKNELLHIADLNMYEVKKDKNKCSINEEKIMINSELYLI